MCIVLKVSNFIIMLNYSYFTKHFTYSTEINNERHNNSFSKYFIKENRIPGKNQDTCTNNICISHKGYLLI